ncbi:DUF6550 family protein [Fusibacter sp. 3D3]|uniref:DUF6550 family protein n=1 Tax=Fusibacter sp. 3D3 TaxID=1048380 RepID=UPI0008537825|nr:DUF6550 family protein [Fusibacter sp. 3D3]GAU76833.1 hypothetical protein F3D3_1431 [Fusibacter sp. 3D3]
MNKKIKTRIIMTNLIAASLMITTVNKLPFEVINPNTSIKSMITIADSNSMPLSKSNTTIALDQSIKKERIAEESKKTVVSKTNEKSKPNNVPSITIPKTTKSYVTASPQNKTPNMGDTRIVNGQKQVYFLGFGWIEDDNKPNEEITANDMFENGNKVGNMEGSKVMDSDGDIDKMVGKMGD